MRHILAALFLVSVLGCGSASAPSATPPATTSTATATDTATATSTTPAAPVFTAAQKAAIINTINTMGASAVQLGLDEWAKSNNAIATDVAKALKANIEATVLPILNDQNVQVSDALAAVSSNLYINIPPLVQLGIEGAGVLLNQFFTVPGVKDSDKIDFIKAFVAAIDGGVNDYLTNPPAIGSVVAKNALAKTVKK